MSFDVNIECRVGSADIAARFQSAAKLTAIFGPSGAGKTSILNMVAGLLRPDRGHIVIGGETLFDSANGINVAVRHRRAGYVFQDGRLFPHMSVRNNLLYGFRLARTEQRWMPLNDVIALLGIGRLLDRWPSTLSGGEAQRVGIGRALLSGPRFLLMDEPLASLDMARRAEILQLIERVRDEIDIPILYVSHDRGEVDRLTDRIVLLG